MPQIKKQQGGYGIKHAALDAVARHLKGRDDQPTKSRLHLFTGKELSLLIEIAATPSAFTGLRSGVPRHVEAFGALYAREPDAVLDIMRITRKELAKQQRKQAGVVRHFLLTHETVSVTKEKQKDGTFKLADSNARDAAPCFCVEDLARRKSRDVSDLTDGELAEILTRPTLRIEAASVKAERKQRRKHK